FHHVPHVVALSPGPQAIGIHTERVITTMQDLDVRRDVAAVVERPRHAMGQGVSLWCDRIRPPVATRGEDPALPDPTRRRFLDVAPETLCKRLCTRRAIAGPRTVRAIVAGRRSASSTGFIAA